VPSVMDPEAGRNYVYELGLDIQRGFRRKLLAILTVQLCLSLGVGFALRFALPLDALTAVFPAQSIQTLLLGALCICCLPALSFVRDRYPCNMIMTTGWSAMWGIFLAAAQVPGGIIRSFSMFVMFGGATVGVAFLLILSTAFTFTDPESGERALCSFSSAGTWAWVLMVAASIGIYSATKDAYEQVGHYIGAMIVATCIFVWVAYDSAKLCQRMSPDDYMRGVVYFYTDFLLVCCCCLVAGCFSASAS